jgi:hypothetical protein
MRISLVLMTALIAMSAVGCGGGSSMPTAPGSITPSILTVAIAGVQGNGSYVPNPVPTSGNQVMFKNNDTVNTHHIVMDDGSADFGSLAPGASSAPKSVSSGNFHCQNHPSMVGSINGLTAPEPAPGSGGGY